MYAYVCIDSFICTSIYIHILFIFIYENMLSARDPFFILVVFFVPVTTAGPAAALWWWWWRGVS